MRGFCARCGCPKVWHTHYREGVDCGNCGRDACPAYRPPGLLARLRRFRRRHGFTPQAVERFLLEAERKR